MSISDEHRLPRHVVPERYVLELRPDLDSASFTGSVSVSLQAHEAVSQIVLNAAELDISSAILNGPGSPAQPCNVSTDDDTERATLGFETALEPGEHYRLDLEFSGILNDKLRGFYRSTFTDDEGRERVIATTQFEPADARRAFPCWDEPDRKAVFEVTLVVEEGQTAISNSASVSDTAVEGDRRRVRFAPTMKMSTYLVAFVVGPFELTEPVEVDQTPVRIVTPPGKSHLSPYAVEAATFALRFLAGYFELPYPGDKIDHVAIPDFAFGAMENLGCVTYRETALLLDTATASQLERQRVATVVAHETAHMWFGDLVTMRWWNGIWLNEAFATFMELTTTDAFNPEWEVWNAFGASKAAALVVDGLLSTRPVEFEVAEPADAEAMFDVLTYEKGGSVLKMLEQYLGPEVLRKGIAEYLHQHSYANTETTDLWDSIESVSGEPVRSIMDTWIFQGGYPIVEVALGGAETVELRQRRFTYAAAGAAAKGRRDAGAPQMWAVPVNLRASVAGAIVKRRLLLDGPSAEVRLDGPVDWAVVNEGAWGFYRTAYSTELMGRLVGAGLQQVCDPLERMSVLGDGFAGVVAGALELTDWVALTAVLADEDDPDVWNTVLSALGALNLVTPEQDLPLLQRFVRRVATPAFATLGWDPPEGERARLGIARSRLIFALGVLGADPEVRAQTAVRHERLLEDRSSLSPDVVTAVVGVLAAAGGAEAYEIILGEYRRAANPQDKIRYLMALAGSEDPELLRRTLEFCLTDEVRNQDAPLVVGNVLASRAGRHLAWPWMEAHWDELLGRFPHNLLIRTVEGIASIASEEAAQRVHRWLADHPLPVGGPRVAQLEERMDITVSLAARVGPGVGAALG